VESYQFKGYLLRPSLASDLELARLWTARDPDHAGRVDPGFWLSQGRYARAYLLSDADGPVFFFKGILRLHIPAIEVHIQFPPDIDEPLRNMRRRRISQGLIEGLAWLEERMSGTVNEIIFESTTPALIRFCQRHLGFTHENGQLKKRLPLHQLAEAGD
jgi:hypothetical protein